MLVEGYREVERCILAGYQVCLMFWNQEDCPVLPSVIADKKHVIVKISRQISKYMSIRETPSGIMGVFQRGTMHYINEIHPLANGTFILLDNLYNPGNIGAIIRSAAAFSINGILMFSRQDIDVFSPQVIRNSMGAVFSIKIYHVSYDDVLVLSQDKSFILYVLDPTDDCIKLSNYKFIANNKSAIFVFGAEDNGISSFWRDLNATHICVDMPGVQTTNNTIDSLNVSNTASIVLFEQWRQRGRLII